MVKGLNLGKNKIEKKNIIQMNTHIHNGGVGGSSSWGSISGDITNQTDLQESLSLKADLVGGKVPSSQLPSFVDDVIEVADFTSLPVTGEQGKIYITIDNNNTYRWTGSVYVQVGGGTTGVVYWDDVQNKPTTFTPNTHTHTISDVTGLQTELDSKVDSINAGTGIDIDNSDPANPVVSIDDTHFGGLAFQDFIVTNAIVNYAVTNTKLAQMNANTVKGRLSGNGEPQDIDMADLPISTATQTALDGKLSTILKGANNGLAELDSNGKVPSSQLPSFVDDVIEVADFTSLPVTGEAGKIYITIDTNVTYRRGGTSYVEISSSLVLGETSSTAYRGDRGKIAYDHSQLTSGNPHNVTKTDVGLSNVDNTSDINKPISTATQTALDNKQDTLVSSTNIKTINGESVLGGGNISVGGLGDISCRVFNNAAVAITVGAFRNLTWNSESYDTHSFHDNTTNNSRFTIPSGQGGKYFIISNITTNQGYGGDQARIIVNNSNIVSHHHNQLSHQGINMSAECYLNEGDYVEVQYYPLQASCVLQTNSNFSIRRVA